MNVDITDILFWGAVSVAIIVSYAKDQIDSLIHALKIWINGRNKRLLDKQRHNQNLEKIKIKQKHELEMANKITDSIQLLTLDPKFGEDFDRRLRVALEEKRPIDPIEEDFQEEKTTSKRKRYTK